MERSTPHARRRKRRVALTAAAAAALLAPLLISASAQADHDGPIGPVNGGFEEPAGDGIPGWTQRGGSVGGSTVVDDPVFAGEQSLRFDDPEDTASYGLMSDPMPVEAGHTYQLSAQAYVEQGVPTLYVYFYDEAGSQLDVEFTHFTSQPTGSWAPLSLDATAPEGATSAAVYIYSTIARVSTFYVDEVQLRHLLAPLQIEDLGPAFYSPNVRLADVDVLSDGTPVGYVFSDGEPVSFNVVDLRTGAMRDSHDMDGYSIAASIEIAPDDTVYFSVRGPNDGTLWTYDPHTQQVRKLASRIAGENLLRTLVLDGDVLYGSTYPNAKVYSYDTLDGEIRDYGSVVDDGSAYAWGLDVVDDALWVGTGATPHLMEVDPVSGAVTERALPAGVAETADFVNRVERHGDVVFISYSPAGAGGDNTAVYDLAAREWLPGLEGGAGSWTEDAAGGLVYYVSGDTIRAYDIAARQSVTIGWENGPLVNELEGTTDLALVELGTAEFPGTTLVGVRVDGAIWRYDLESGTGDVVHSEIVGAPATVHSLGIGGDGAVYAGAYLSAGVMARVDESGVQQLSGPKQADSIIAHRERTVVGVYPGAEFYVGHSRRPWEWGRNPKHLFGLGRGETGQDRPMAMTAAREYVAAGTVPNYGELGGALTLFNPATGAYESHRNVVPEQSVTALAYRDGLVYGGTSIHGGLSSVPTRTEAELFVWDIRAGELVESSVVVPGAEVIHALTFDDAGRLWGLADNGVVFEYDPATREVVRTVRTPATSSNIWGRLSELYQHPGDGHIYGNANGRLFRLDPRTLEFVTLIASGARHSVLGEDGAIYVADETNIFRYTP